MKITFAVVAAGLLLSLPAHAEPKCGDGGNPANEIHPNILNNVGDGSNANPGVGNDNGNQLHGIANTYGQGGDDPNDGDPGFADSLEDVHGGISCANKNAEG